MTCFGRLLDFSSPYGGFLKLDVAPLNLAEGRLLQVEVQVGKQLVLMEVPDEGAG